MAFKITEDEFTLHAGEYDGICLTCGDWTVGGVEPDAEGYRCTVESCQQLTVMGAEQALLSGHIEFTEPK